MKVILREDVKGKGAAGDIVEVKPGFARNYLVPRGFAYIASNENLKVYEADTYRKAKKNEQLLIEAEQKRVEIEKISLTAAMKVGEDGKLYGSVTTHMIADLLREKGYDYNHRKILLDEPIEKFELLSSEPQRDSFAIHYGAHLSPVPDVIRYVILSI